MGETPIRSAAIPPELEDAARRALKCETASASTLLRAALARAAGIDIEEFNGSGRRRWRADMS